MKKFALLAIALAGTAAIAKAEPGVRSIAFDAPHRHKPVEALIWYPAAMGVATPVGDNPVFVGTPALKDAPPVPGKRPLVILSHGSGGNAANLGWISARLAEAGFVVAAPNHPGSTSGDSRPETTIKAGERPRDVAALISTVAAMREFDVDLDRVAILGFSLGGYTALASAGATVKAADYARYCDANPAAMDCQWFARGNKLIPGHVDLHAVDAAPFDADYRDPRIKVAIAVDPALAPAYAAESLGRIAAPVLVINLGTGEDIPLGLRGEKLASAMPDAAYVAIPGADHFAFLGRCKPGAVAMLRAEGEDDPICDSDVGGRRQRLHQDIAAKIVEFLKAKL